MFFGFLTYPHTSLCALTLSHIVVFAIDLKSAYEAEYMIIGLLSLANFAQNNVLQFHPFTWE
jgi:hypothetical protein